MTITGKIFAFLNLLLAFAFLYAAAPVYQDRINKLAAINAELAKIQPLKVSIDGLVRARAKHIADHDQYKESLGRVKTSAANRLISLDSRMAIYTNDLNNAKGTEQSLNGSLAASESEIAARDADFQAASADVNQILTTLQETNKHIDGLAAKKQTLTNDFAKLKGDNESIEKQLKVMLVLREGTEDTARVNSAAQTK